MREFLYIRNSHPRPKLALLAEKCTAGMHVNTHSCPLRTQKLTIIHGFLPRLTLTSEGGELVNPQKTKIHNETQEICVISLRRSRGRMILNARKCWAWRREGWISEKEVKKISQIVNFLEKTSETASLLLILPVTIQLFQNSFVSSSSSLSCTNQMTKVSSWLLFNPFSTFRCQGQSWQESMKFRQFFGSQRTAMGIDMHPSCTFFS